MKREKAPEQYLAEFHALGLTPAELAEHARAYMAEVQAGYQAMLACSEASKASRATVQAGLGRTPQDRAVLAQQLRPLTEPKELPVEIWALARVVCDVTLSCRQRGRAARALASQGYDTSDFFGHPLATHRLVDENTGRDYYLAV